MGFGGDEWKMNKWYIIGIGDDITGPPEVDHYNGPHGLKPGVADIFETVIQCIFKLLQWTWIQLKY